MIDGELGPRLRMFGFHIGRASSPMDHGAQLPRGSQGPERAGHWVLVCSSETSSCGSRFLS